MINVKQKGYDYLGYEDMEIDSLDKENDLYEDYDLYDEHDEHDEHEEHEEDTVEVSIENEFLKLPKHEITLEINENANGEKQKLTEEEKIYVAENNVNLIYHMAKQFRNSGAEYNELISAGMVGYAKALDSYDKGRGVKFSTYAINCIKNEILFFLRKENKHNKNTTSLNKILSFDKNGNSLELEEIMANDKAGDKAVEELILEDENKKLLLKAMEHLKEEERFILIYRFGLDRGIIKTQKEIADMINMSQANVSKIQKNSLHKLKLILRKELM